MDFARGFETKEAFGLRDFIRYMEKLLVAEAQESEAQVELEEADTVKLMSVHKAKGLEFPVVALADLGYEPRNWEGGRLNFSGSQGLGLKVKNETTHEWHETWSYAENKSQEQRKNRDEHKRLFYVALTRAEEHLLLSGVARPVKEGALEEAAYRDLSSWMDWLRKAFSGSETDVNGRLLFEGLPVHVPAQEAETSPHRRLPLLAETSPFKEALTELRPLDERALKKLEERLFPGITEDALTRAALPAAKETPYYETLDLPVSALLKFEECPGCYYDLYEMREPDKMRDEPVDESEEPEEEEETPLARREFGNLFHRIMQHFDFEAPVDAELARRLEEVRPFVNEAELHELEQSVRNFLGGEWGAVFKRSELYRELPFIYKLTRGELRGQIDVAAKTPEGEWIVLDYKTGRATAEESGERAREYELQILIYSLALRDTGGYVPKRGILYFTSPDRSHFIDLSPESLDRTREKINKLLEDMVLQQRPFKHQAPKCRKQ